MGVEARVLGHGGTRAVARTARVCEATVRRGVDEWVAGEEPLGRARRHGGGRKKAVDLDPGLRPALRRWWNLTSGAIRCRRCAGR